MIPFVDEIYLDIIPSALCIVFCFAIILFGRPEIPLGIYLSMLGWTRGVHIGPVGHNWVLLITIIGAFAVATHKSRWSANIPIHHRWIILWVIVWWFWMYLLMVLFGPLFIPGEQRQVMTTLLFMVILPVSIIPFIPFDLHRVKGFAVSYLATAIAGGWIAVILLGIPIEKIISDPTLATVGVVRLGIINYHYFSYPLAISLVFTLALLVDNKSSSMQLILLMIGLNLVYFLILAGSRQSIIGVSIACVIMFSWMQLRRRSSLIFSIVLVVTIAGIVYWLVDSSPALLRAQSLDSNQLSTALDVRESRQSYWVKGLQLFTESPLWGFGFSKHSFSHNFFIGTLVDQGIVGMVFLLGVLSFWFMQSDTVWRGSGDEKLDAYRMAFFCITVFALLHSQASGSPVSVWHFWWSIAFQWKLKDIVYTGTRRIPLPDNQTSCVRLVGSL
jgi:hypothetical protein